jgi:hypothetical protein
MFIGGYGAQKVIMHILKEGRSAYLEFLRNLIPQALWLSFTLVAG